MNGLGTDVMALACILGSAAAAGAATLVIVDRDRPVGAAHPCYVASVEARPTVVLSLDGERVAGSTRVIVAPKMRMRPYSGCESMATAGVELRMEEAARRMERARVEVERARERMDRLERSRSEADVDAELRRLEERLARLRASVGR
jgi:hypothetical protein